MVRRSVVLSMFRGFVLLTVAWIASPPLHAQTYQVIHNFDPSSPVGTIPQGLTRDAAGNLFGTTLYALQYQGTVFKLDTTHTFTVLHTFTDPKDGAGGKGPLILDSAGNVYGTTLSGGDKDFGMVFKVDPTGVETVLHSFSGSTGKFPNALTRDPAGNLYGTTSSGLREGGVVFRINTFGTGRTLHRFTGPDGDEPGGGLARDSAGNLYGTTAQGGDFGEGTLFILAPNGTETVLHSFTGGADGGSPFAEPLLDSEGNLYSTTLAGGTFKRGTVFKLDSAGNFSVVHSFNGADGRQPFSGVVMDAAGNLYGSTPAGGDFDLGVVFKIDLSGNETVLHSFRGGADGSIPGATLVLTPDGTIFGSTGRGGIYGVGTLFKLKP